MTSAEKTPPLSRVLLVAYLPTFIYSIGQGTIVPVIPAVAESLGAELGFAGFIAGSLLIGQALGNLPAGIVVSRIGERRSMLISAFATIIGALISVTASTPWQLLIGVIVQGMMAATFALARQAFMSTYVPLRYRARAMSTLGGVFRSGMFVGPFIASALISATGNPQLNFFAFIVCSLLVVVVLVVLPDIERFARPTAKAEPHQRVSVFVTMRENFGVLARLGVGSGILMALRVSRQVLLPLWGLSLGMDAAAVSLIVGIGGAIDFALFFTSGWIMDRFGRLASALPALVGLGLGFLALSFLHDVPNAQWWFTAVTIMLALANGVGSGIVMTLGADLADPDDPAPFLGAWRLIVDSSGAAVPFLITALQFAVGLPATAGVFGGIGLLGAWMMARWIPKYVPAVASSDQGEDAAPTRRARREPPPETGAIELD